MSDLIRRKDLVKELNAQFAVGDITREIANDILNHIPSADPERTAKVIIHKYWFGVSLNVVGEQTIGYEWICENCKKMVVEGDDYCSHCGAKLIWGEDDE